MNEIIVALITGGLALLGTIISGRNTVDKVNRTMMQNISTSQAVTDTKIEELTREVREHNHFARRVPVLEEKMKVADHRISDLEEYHKGV